jgi:SAM-dependent methyltransferase
MGDEASPVDLLALAGGYQLAQCISAAARLGLADELAAGPRHYTDLAAATGSHPPSLRRLLRALAAEGIFAEPALDTFAITEVSEQLRAGVPGSVRPYLLGWVGLPAMYLGFAGLLDAVRTGQAGLRHATGQDFFEYLDAHPQAAADYDAAMESTVDAFVACADAYDFSRFGTVVDVGGGHGGLLATLLERYPEMRGVNLERPEVAAAAATSLAGRGLGDRVRCVGGDFFDSVPPGGDGYLLCTILHVFPDDACLRILRNCRAAMGGGARLVVVDKVIPPGPATGRNPLSDLRIFLLSGGGERTGAEFAALFAATGFALGEIAPVAGLPLSTVEGLPV